MVVEGQAIGYAYAKMTADGMTTIMSLALLLHAASSLTRP